jgi:hypothetical protein
MAGQMAARPPIDLGPDSIGVFFIRPASTTSFFPLPSFAMVQE